MPSAGKFRIFGFSVLMVTALIVGCATQSLSVLSGVVTAAAPQPTAEEISELRGDVESMIEPMVIPRMDLSVLQPWDLKSTAADALARIGAEAVMPLADKLSDPDPRVRIEATGALARMGTVAEPAVSQLIALLSDPEEQVRIGAARALGQIGPGARDAISPLVRILGEPEPSQAAY